MTMIMVSYRRADAQDMAGRISDHLIGKYGEKSVFFDFNSISTGVNYRKRIEKAIRESDVIVAVVACIGSARLRTESRRAFTKPTTPCVWSLKRP